MKKKIKPSLLLIMLFMASVVFYGYFASRMSGIVFYPGDESRFVSLAKSIHFRGNISEHYMMKSYDDILYPSILSLGYFFYSPKFILTILRWLGVIIMSSVVFPTFYLAKKMDLGRMFKVDTAFFVSIISVIIPEMTYSLYLLEEVVFYPLFMWMLYFLYRDIEEKNNEKINISMLVVFFLMYITKTFSIVFIMMYCFLFFGYGIKKRNKRIIIKAVISGVLFLVFFGGLRVALWFLNDMQIGTSHYTSYAAQIFPPSIQMIVSVLRGMLFYSCYFILFTGIVPVIVLCSNLANLKKTDLLWCIYLLGALVLVILEVVVIMHYTENGLDLEPSRFHYRYLFYFFMPLLMITLKYKAFGNRKIASGIIIFEMIVFNNFFAPINKTGQGICDGIACFIVKAMDKYIGFTQCFLVLTLIFLGVLLLLLDRKDKTKNAVLWSVAGIGMLLVVMIFPAIKIPLDNSSKTSFWKKDYIQVAEYVNENAEEILCLSNEGIDDPVFRSSAYHKKDFREAYLETDNEIEINSDSTVILVSNKFPYGFLGDIREIKLDLKNMRIYMANKGKLEIDKGEYNFSFGLDEYVVNGYDQNGVRYLMEDGISYGPYIELEAGVYQIEVVGDNLLNSSMLSYTGTENFDVQMLELNNQKAIAEVELKQKVGSFEFSIRNKGNGLVVINSMRIKKKPS